MRTVALASLVLLALGADAYFSLQSPLDHFKVAAVGTLDTVVGHPAASEVESTQTTVAAPDIYFLGDVMLARDVERRILQNGLDYPFAEINFPKESLVVANFESAIPKVHINTPNNTFRFSTSRVLLPLLNTLGVTHVSLANNHTYDFGLAGYNDSVAALWEVDVVPFGHPTQVASSSVQYLTTASGTVAVLALHTLFAKPDEVALAALLAEAQSESDWQVVYVHWGDEYVTNPNVTQRALAKFLVNEGADLIIGHHPHVTQRIERVDGVLVMYSLGNFIFDQYFSKDVQEGLVARLGFAETPYVELLPVSSESLRIQPRFLEGEEKLRFLEQIATSSDPVLSESIRAGLIPL